jgi:hypothetical protein
MEAIVVEVLDEGFADGALGLAYALYAKLPEKMLLERLGPGYRALDEHALGVVV